jgi:HK97 family phage portal protein
MSKPGILARISRYLPFMGQERRSNYIDGDSNYLSIWQDNPSQPDQAVTVAAVHRCVSLISQTIATLPCILYQETTGTRERCVGHPLYPILRKFANDEHGAFQFWEKLVTDAILWGNGYATIERNDEGRPTALRNLDSQYVTADRMDDGKILYTFDVNGQAKEVFPALNVIHLRCGPVGADGICSESVLHRAFTSLQICTGAEEFAQKLFSSGIRPAGVLQHPGRLTPESVERLRADFSRIHSGSHNAHKVVVLENGMTWNQTSANPEDAQFLQSREFQIREVARWFGVPVTKLMEASSGYSSLEAENQAFLTNCLQPWLQRLEQELELKCLLDAERVTHNIEFLVEGLLRSDTATRYQIYSVGRNWGLLTINECRRMESLPAVEGGDALMQPMNMQTLSDTGVGARAPSGTQPTTPVDDTASPPTTLAGGDSTGDSETNELPTRESVIRLADDMTTHQVTHCEHGRRNRCTICGIERERELVPSIEPGGEHTWKIKWVPIGVQP